MFTSSGFAQNGTIMGIVTDDSGEPLIGVSVVASGTGTGASTDLDGQYQFNIAPGNYNIAASYVGYETLNRAITVRDGETAALNFVLSSGVLVDEVVVIGTRASNRTNLESAVPIDVINISKLATAAPQTSLNQILHQSAPSFSSNTQTISDGTDHIDPASLRGLGPDQVLVLVNGKRRHSTSLVNVNGTFGRGNVGTDLNAIPATAIEKIEVLRDGAAAQYGSDAIAGVINVVLKDDVDKLNFNVTTGANFTDGIGAFGGELRDRDGEVFFMGANYGLPLGEKGSVNVTGELNFRNPTSRMIEFEGGIFSGYNAIERLAAADGFDVNALTDQQILDYGADVESSIFNQDAKALLASMSGDELRSTDDVIRQINGEDVAFANPLAMDITDAELSARGQTRSDYNMRVGQSGLRGGKMFANFSMPLVGDSELYAFGGTSYRRGESGCFYRLPGQSRTTTSIYANGTVPKINSNITDGSLGAGIRGKVANWNTDLSLVNGNNKFLYQMTDTHNATLGTASPTSFDAGGHSFNQTTGNLDFSQYFDGISGLVGFNVGFGAEYRTEGYNVIPGSEASYGRYDINGNLVNSTTPDELIVTDILGRSRPSGSQCFAGFLPSNVVDANRSSVGAYVDAEFDVTEAFLVGGALRFEDYSDFGSTFNYKGSARYKVNDNFAIRAAASTGFRAPSLHQIHFSRTSTVFNLVDGVSIAQEVGVFTNTSRAAKLLGIPELKEETSNNVSAGFTAKIPTANLRLTVDAYQVHIDDRVILTGQFSPGGVEDAAKKAELEMIFEQAGATAAAFFANAISTDSRGLDIVLAHDYAFAEGRILRNDLSATFSQTVWDKEAGINASPVLEEAGLVGTYFDQTSRIYLEQAVPRVKVTLGNTLRLGALNVYLRNTYFGQTTEATGADIFDADLNLLADATIDPYNDPKIITDLSLGYNITENLSLKIGANNLLDVFPDEADSSFTSSGRFVYSRRSPQFSYSGRHLFARLLLEL